MKIAGRASPVLIMGVLSVVVFVGVLFTGGGTPTSTASSFMVALGKRDIDTLVELSALDGKTPEELREAWKYSTETVGKHYRFAFNILASREANETTSTVTMHVFRNADMSSTYAEKFELPLVKVDGKWLVEVRGINRQMYPGLPR